MHPPRPVALAVIPENIPTEMQCERRWVVWRYTLRANLGTGERKWTKPPYQAGRPQSPASTTDPATWGTYARALAAYQHGEADGIGFVLGDGWAGVDLDHVVEPETRTLAPWAQGEVEAFATYTEYSPSGAGIRLLLHGCIVGADGYNRPSPAVGVRVEAYSDKKFLTVTGHHLPGTPATMELREAELNDFCSRHFPPTSGPTQEHQERRQEAPHEPLGLDDEALLNKALAANDGGKFAALWHGELAGYPSASEAVAALLCKVAFWTRKDADRMDRWFRQSGLMSEKWDSRRGDTTWGALEIARATALTSEVYTPARERADRDQLNGHRPSGATGSEQEQSDSCQSSSQEEKAGERADSGRTTSYYPLLTDEEVETFEPARGLVGDILPEDCLAYLYGDGDTWKTFIALSWGLCLAAEHQWLGRTVLSGPVVYVAAEGGRGLAKRITAWKQHYNITKSVPFFVVPMPVNLTDAAGVPRLIASIRGHHRLKGQKPVLIVFDTLARSMDGADENGTQAANQVTSATGQLRDAFGCCVLLLHHSGKDSHRGMRGNSAYRNNADVVLRVVAPALAEGQHRQPGDVITLRSEKTKEAEPFSDIHVTTQLVKWTVDDGAADGAATMRSSLVIMAAGDSPRRPQPIPLAASRQKALDALALAQVQAPGGLTAGEWEQAAVLAGTTFHEARRDLSQHKYVEQEEKEAGGRYRVTHTGWDKVGAEVRARYGGGAGAPDSGVGRDAEGAPAPSDVGSTATPGFDGADGGAAVQHPLYAPAPPHLTDRKQEEADEWTV